MELVVRRELVALVTQVAPPKAQDGHHLRTTRCCACMQWFGLSDLAMEEALFDVPLYRTFAGLGNAERLPDPAFCALGTCLKSTNWPCKFWQR
jgi:IS5 family transposase